MANTILYIWSFTSLSTYVYLQYNPCFEFEGAAFFKHDGPHLTHKILLGMFWI